jgi:hypothetical protein
MRINDGDGIKAGIASQKSIYEFSCIVMIAQEIRPENKGWKNQDGIYCFNS